MAEMVRADDFVIVFPVVSSGLLLHELENASVGHAIAPRDMKIVKLQGILSVGGGTGSGVFTVTSDKGALADTLSILASGTVGDVTEQDVRDEADNAFAKGERIQLDGGGEASTAGDAHVQAICRPL